MKRTMMRLEKMIDQAEKDEDQTWLERLLWIRDGSPLQMPDTRSNVARLYDRERKMNGW